MRSSQARGLSPSRRACRLRRSARPRASGMVRPVRYEEPPHLPHDEATSILECALAEFETSHASAVIVGFGLFDDDQEYVEGWCRRIARDAADPALRGSAALSAAHLARRFCVLAPETLMTVRVIAADPLVDGRKYDALEDVERFVVRRDL